MTQHETSSRPDLPPEVRAATEWLMEGGEQRALFFDERKDEPPDKLGSAIGPKGELLRPLAEEAGSFHDLWLSLGGSGSGGGPVEAGGTTPRRKKARAIEKPSDVRQQALEGRVFWQEDERLSELPKLLLGLLWDKAVKDGNVKVVKSMQEMAEKLGYNERSVQKAMDRLEAAGYLVKFRRNPAGKGGNFKMGERQLYYVRARGYSQGRGKNRRNAPSFWWLKQPWFRKG